MRTARELIERTVWVKAESPRHYEIGVMLTYIEEGHKEFFIIVKHLIDETYNLNATDRLRLNQERGR